MDMKKRLAETLEIFMKTWEQVIIHPRTFFRERNRDEPWQEVITFNVVCGLLAGLINTVLTFGSGISTVIVYPILIITNTAIIGSVLFLFFKLSGGEGAFEPTIKMVGYTQAVSVFSYGIPGLGLLLAMYQILLLTAVGKFLHELDTRTSFLAVAIPIFLYLILIAFVATILGVSFWGDILSHEGEVL